MAQNHTTEIRTARINRHAHISALQGTSGFMRTLRPDFISGLLGIVEAGGPFCRLFYEGHIKIETLIDKHSRRVMRTCVPTGQNKKVLREFYEGFRHDCLLGTKKKYEDIEI